MPTPPTTVSLQKLVPALYARRDSTLDWAKLLSILEQGINLILCGQQGLTALSFTAVGGEVVLTVPPYIVGAGILGVTITRSVMIDSVPVDIVIQVPLWSLSPGNVNGFTETSATTITLGTACQVGDVVTVSYLPLRTFARIDCSLLANRGVNAVLRAVDPTTTPSTPHPFGNDVSFVLEVDPVFIIRPAVGGEQSAVLGFDYVIGTNSLIVTKNSAPLVTPGDYTEVSINQITLAVPLAPGDALIVERATSINVDLVNLVVTVAVADGQTPWNNIIEPLIGGLTGANRIIEVETPNSTPGDVVLTPQSAFSAYCSGAQDFAKISVDGMTTVFDPIQAESRLLPYIAQMVGWDLDVNLQVPLQRKITSLIFDLLREKGTRNGIIDGIRLLLGIEATVDEFWSDGWSLGYGVLGEASSFSEEDLPTVLNPIGPWDPAVEYSIGDVVTFVVAYVALVDNLNVPPFLPGGQSLGTWAPLLAKNGTMLAPDSSADATARGALQGIAPALLSDNQTLFGGGFLSGYEVQMLPAAGGDTASAYLHAVPPGLLSNNLPIIIGPPVGSMAGTPPSAIFEFKINANYVKSQTTPAAITIDISMIDTKSPDALPADEHAAAMHTPPLSVSATQAAQVASIILTAINAGFPSCAGSGGADSAVLKFSMVSVGAAGNIPVSGAAWEIMEGIGFSGGTDAPVAAAAVTGTVQGTTWQGVPTWPMQNGHSINFNIDGGSGLVATINANPVVKALNNNATYVISNGDTITYQIGSALAPIRTITFENIVTNGAALPQEVKDNLAAQMLGFLVSLSGTQVTLTSDRSGSGAFIKWVGGTSAALTTLGITSGEIDTPGGSNNVADADHVTAVELNTIFQAISMGVVFSASLASYPVPSRSVVGSAHSLAITGGSGSADLGLAVGTYVGISGSCFVPTGGGISVLSMIAASDASDMAALIRFQLAFREPFVLASLDVALSRVVLSARNKGVIGNGTFYGTAGALLAVSANVFELTSAGGEKTINLGFRYTTGSLAVYIDGALTAAYTESIGTSITLTAALTEGQVLVVRGAAPGMSGGIGLNKLVLTFRVTVPVLLTSDQDRMVRSYIDFTKRAETHYVLVQDDDTIAPDFILDVSHLGHSKLDRLAGPNYCYPTGNDADDPFGAVVGRTWCISLSVAESVRSPRLIVGARYSVSIEDDSYVNQGNSTVTACAWSLAGGPVSLGFSYDTNLELFMAITGLSAIDSDRIGHTIVVSGTGNSVLNGSFKIVAVLSSTSVLVFNPQLVVAGGGMPAVSVTLSGSWAICYDFLIPALNQFTVTPSSVGDAFVAARRFAPGPAAMMRITRMDGSL